MKENKKTIQVLAIVTLLIAIVCISVGFALLSQNLTIEGQAKIIPANWSVHFVTLDTSTTPATGGYTFDNDGTSAYEAHTDSVTTGVSTAPSLTTSVFSGYNCILTRPGDKCIYTFDVINDGDINATISGLSPANLAAAALTITGSGATASADEAKVANDISYNVVWDDGSDTAIATGQDLLTTDGAKTIKVEIEYLSREGQELPQNPVTITGKDLVITYQQKNS